MTKHELCQGFKWFRPRAVLPVVAEIIQAGDSLMLDVDGDLILVDNELKANAYGDLPEEPVAVRIKSGRNFAVTLKDKTVLFYRDKKTGKYEGKHLPPPAPAPEIDENKKILNADAIRGYYTEKTVWENFKSEQNRATNYGQFGGNRKESRATAPVVR